MRMRLIATVQHHGVYAVYIINALYSLLYPTMTYSWMQVPCLQHSIACMQVCS